MSLDTRERVKQEQSEQHGRDETRGEGGKRLVVELNGVSQRDLAWLVDAEELNKTTVVNRALQVYRMVIETQQNGGSMILDDPSRGGQERVRVI